MFQGGVQNPASIGSYVLELTWYRTPGWDALENHLVGGHFTSDISGKKRLWNQAYNFSLLCCLLAVTCLRNLTSCKMRLIVSNGNAPSLDVVAHTFKASTREAEAGELSSRSAWSMECIPGQLRLGREPFCYQKKKGK